MQLNIHIQLLTWIIGKWKSFEVKGAYPTIRDFSYYETVEFEFIGQPVINFSSIAFDSASSSPKHLERGFLKIKPGTEEVAFVNSHTSGISVVEEGIVKNCELNLETKSINRITFARSPFVTKVNNENELISNI